jgi:multidrug efflux pump subunit AcrA (membrane-fusion protein)
MINRVIYKRIALILAAAFAAGLVGCALLPVEDEVVAAPVLKPYEAAQYSVFAAVRGDLFRKARLNVSYTPTRSEPLAFDEGGILFHEITVKAGDAVRPGDIVATLELKELDEAITGLEWDIEANEAAVRDREALYELEKKSAPYTQTSAALQLAYKKDMAALAAEGESLRLSLERNRARRERRILRANMGGVVTYVKSLGGGELSVRGERVVTVTDQNSSAFVVTGQYAGLLTPGMDVEVAMADGVHQATVLEASALNAAGQPDQAYIALDDSSAVRENAAGTIEVVVDERLDVVYVPTEAVQTVRGQPYVTMMTDNLRATRDVETGMDDGVFIEIVSGLEEGEEVVY